ncbi:response regulator [Microbacterium ulmi]|uniref:Response regulator transcription factor n=1 Tax=Microbacterium ulmi TaxID=179095 RepID=A0A7Y2Q118_9MICO|nr:DNA-binding NarL/FixJ family response regulator [Microbacterium ulmi]NNH03208.1 response regulator transcription factor [Microbacterium ulmi]
MTRVFLVDEHEIVRRGVAQLIGAAPDLEVVGEASTTREALRRIDATTPDVAVLDVRLPDGSGIDLCRSIRSRHPSIACLMLTAFDDDDALRAAVLAGASGYVLKDVRGPSIVDAIRRAAAGGTVQSPELLQRAAASLAPAQATSLHLTYREGQVLDLISEGLTNRGIGERLGLAEKTVKNYVSGLLAKLGMTRRTQAAVYGAEHRRG